MSNTHDFGDLIFSYRPRSIAAGDWEQVRAYVTAVAIDHLAPKATSRADLRNQMLAVATAAVAALRLGRGVTHQEVLAPEVIEFAIASSKLTSRVKGVRRSILIALGEELNPEWPLYVGARYGYKTPDAPYTEQELALLGQWASGRSTDYQRRGAMTLLALGAGVGLRIGEMAHLRVCDVSQDGQGVTVTASGYRGAEPRHVPVRAEWEDELKEAIADLDPDSLALFPNRSQPTTESVAAIITRIGKPHRVHLDTRRLRTTWVVTLMHEYVPESVIAPAAGLASLQHYKKWLTPANVNQEQAFALLRGGTRHGSTGLRVL
ncbi:site-specific integrase [Corynebacterium cystitidis]|uniref:Phage integrase family protein n=1 Tax=Corynebacterium cystitidis DSM 20524 TaxID=1121357 RepID=A0A1H9WMN9_9CORY|nr:site-specific integrase [Corynebacterium cystitidis]WJY82829.1 Phage integrase family protein [Corynebacterium cystitidis DSM 20524]SES35170.1 Phage integrase family protein [Corynebacterium cystitidis DSM 20524]SNV70076.1 tyrosine recombinase XerC [Corynebacterium cystitidis]